MSASIAIIYFSELKKFTRWLQWEMQNTVLKIRSNNWQHKAITKETVRRVLIRNNPRNNYAQRNSRCDSFDVKYQMMNSLNSLNSTQTQMAHHLYPVSSWP